MRIVLLISLLLVWPSVAVAADDAQCNAKPFTLNKPKPAPKQPAETAAVDAAKAKPATPKAAPKTSSNQPKPKPIADCKEPKKG
jgi:hypothetical protein